MRSPRAAVLLLALALVLPTAAACGYEDGADDASLSIPLVQTGSDGAVYRLEGSFEITRPDGTSFVEDAGIEASSLSLALAPGLHTIRLEDGWTLGRSEDFGATYEPVEALLGSTSAVTVRLVPNREVGVHFQFLVRSSTGLLTISFGVSASPRQLSAGVRFNDASGAYVGYVGQRVDLQIFFDAVEQRLVTEADGSQARIYTSYENAVEIYNDPVGLLAQVVRAFAGGWLEHTIRIRPDTTASFEGTYFGGTDGSLTFAPSTEALTTAGPDGFPVDGFFYATGSAVEIVTEQGTLSGTLTSIRQFQ